MGDVPNDIRDTAEKVSHITSNNVFAIKNNGVIYVSKMNQFHCNKCRNINSMCIAEWKRFSKIMEYSKEPFFHTCEEGYTFILSIHTEDPDEGTLILGPLTVNDGLTQKSFTAPALNSAELRCWGEMLFSFTNYRKTVDAVADRKKNEISHKVNENLDSYMESSHSLESLMELESKIVNSVLTVDENLCENLLNRYIMITYIEEGIQTERVKFRLTQAIYHISRTVLEKHLDLARLEILNDKILQKLGSIYKREDMYLWLHESIMEILSEYKNSSIFRNNLIIYKIQNYVMNNYQKPIDLKTICQKLDLSYNYVSTIFNKEMKINFRNYLNKVRTEESKHLLVSTSRPIVEISMDVGFTSQSYFTKAFKNETGITPNKYRSIKTKLSNESQGQENS